MVKLEDNELQEKFELLGLSLKKVPKFITDAIVPSFNVSRINNDKDLKVYKFVPISEIEILLTPTLRSEDIKKKISKAIPLKNYLNYDGDEEEIMQYRTLAKIVRNMSITEIEKIEKIQQSFERKRTF